MELSYDQAMPNVGLQEVPVQSVSTGLRHYVLPLDAMDVACICLGKSAEDVLSFLVLFFGAVQKNKLRI